MSMNCWCINLSYGEERNILYIPRVAAGWRLSAGGMGECPDRKLTAFGPDTHLSCLNLTSNQQQLENQTAYVVTNAIVLSS